MRRRIGPRRLLLRPARLEEGGEEAAGERQDHQRRRGQESPVPAHQPAQPVELRPGQRHGDLDPGAGARVRRDATPATEQPRALVEAGEPQPAGAPRYGGIETGAVVHHRQVGVAAGGPQRDLHRPGAGVADDVGERLLGDAIEAESEVRREGARGLQAEPHRQAVPPLDLRAVVAESLGEAAALEDRGMEIVAQAAQILGQFRQAARDGVQLVALGGVLGELPARHPELDAQSGQPLAEVVVDLPGDPLPCLLLDGDTAAGRGGIPARDRAVRHITGPPA